MPANSSTLEVRGLEKGSMEELGRQARRMGVTPEQLVKRLVEKQMKTFRDAREKTFAEITGPGDQGAPDEGEIDRLVEAARERHHRQSRKKR